MKIAHLVQLVSYHRHVEQALRIGLAKNRTYGLKCTGTIPIGRDENDESVLLSRLWYILMLAEHGGQGKNTHIGHCQTNDGKEN